jgi:integrase
MKKNAIIRKANSIGENDGSFRARCRQAKRQTYEEYSADHGISHHVKICSETVSEIDLMAPSSSIMANVTDAESVLSLLGIRNGGLSTNGTSNMVEDAEFEEITEPQTAALTEVNTLALPTNKSKKSGKRTGLSSKVNTDETAEKSPYMIAKEMLKPTAVEKLPETRINQTYTKQFSVSPDGKKVTTSETCEYDKSILYNSVDFSKFKDPKKFVNSLDLTNADIKTCIVEYVKSKSHSMPNMHLYYRMLMSYIIMIERENDLILMPIVVGNQFWEEFESFLINHNLAPNTIYSICGQLRSVIRWAARFKAEVAIDLDDRHFESKVSKPLFGLSEDEISRMYWFNLKSLNLRPQKIDTLRRVRDHFVLSCYLGQRFSDVIRVQSSNFCTKGGDVFKIIQQKTGNIAVLDFNRIYTEFPKHVYDILKKYKFESPWKGDLNNYNRYLHELARYVGLDDPVKAEYKVRGQIIKQEYKKWEVISSHTARRTFITNAVKRGINTQYIKQASGHKSDSSFSRYVLLEE